MGNIIYNINEIFSSIQGEGYHAGRKAVFIRFADCNMKPPCSFCDTDFSVKHQLDLQDLAKEIERLETICCLYVLTGGEPTIQHIIPIIKLLTDGRMCLETNGLLWQRLRDIRLACPNIWITVSPKFQRISYKAFQFANEIKVVYDDRMNLEKIYDKIPYTLKQHHRCYIQPCSENYQPAVDYVMSHPWWRLGIQIHKVIGVR